MRYLTGAYAEAIDELTNLIKVKSDFPDVFYFRGLAYFSLTQFDKAIADYDVAIRIDPDNPFLFYLFHYQL